MKKFFRENRLALLISLVLFIIPFFWHEVGEVDYGGDSTRLYFYDPAAWLKNIALYSINSLPPFGEAIPNFSLIPFLFLLSLLKKILFDSPYLLNNFVNGLVLSGSFLTIYFIADELFNLEEAKQKGKISQIVSGLFFCFSPLLIYSWERALYSFHYQLLAYPLFFLFILRYIKFGKFKYLFFAILTSLLFAMNFSFPGLPWLIAFFSFSFPFFIIFSLITGNGKRLLNGLIFLFVFCLLVNSFDIVPNIYTFVNPSFESISDIEAYSGAGLSYFLSVYPHVRLVYNLTGQDQYNITSGFGSPLQKLIFDFGIKYLFLYFLYPITVVLGLILKDKTFSRKGIKIFNLLFVFFLVILFFMNAGFSSLGLSLYKLFFRLPLFSIFRAYYSKFATIYIFFYSLLLGISLKIILKAIKKSILRKIYIFSVLFLIVLNGWPLITGKIVNSMLWKSDQVCVSSQFNPDYQVFLDYLSRQQGHFKVLGLPLTDENYQVLKGKKEGAYFGPPTIGVLAGKNTFFGTVGFSIFWPAVEKMIIARNYVGLNKLYGLLNIGYVFYNSDSYIYDSFPIYSFFPYSDLLKSIFPDQEAIGKFVSNLNLDRLFSISSFRLFKVKDPTPLFYVPEKTVLVSGDIAALSDIVNFESQQKVVYFFLEQNEDEVKRTLLSSKFDKLYLKAEPKNISQFDQEQNFLHQVFYPFVSRRTKLVWRLSLLAEQYQKWLQRKNPEKAILKNVFYANKRINEILKFNEFVEERINLYQTEIKSGQRIISAMTDGQKKSSFSSLLRLNLQSNLLKLKNEGKEQPPLYPLERFIVETLNSLKSDKGDFNERDEKKVTYHFSVPVEGKYEILVENLEGQQDNFSLVVNNQRAVGSKGITEDNSWLHLGKIDLKEGGGNLTIFSETSFNFLNLGNWLERHSTTQKKYVSREILNWRAGSWYEITGELKERGKLKVIVAEEIGRDGDGQRRLSDLGGYRIIGEESLDETSNDFSVKVKFSYGAKSAGIFIYDQETGNLERDKWKQTLLSLRIKEIAVPNVILRLSEEKPPELSVIPKIFIRKINPTKYELSVEGARQPYYLVMSHGFDKGWRVSLESKNTISNSRHYKANGYANIWQVSPEDSGGKENYKLIVEYWPQRLFYIGTIISAGSVFVLFFFLRLRRTD